MINLNNNDKDQNIKVTECFFVIDTTMKWYIMKFSMFYSRDALATSTINCATSFLSGFVIFSVLGYMSLQSGKGIEEVATEGKPSLTIDF